MPENYYSDAEETPTPAPGGESEGEGSGQTALLDKSILGGKPFNVGDELVLKVEAIHENEIEVSYAKGSGEDEDYSEGDDAHAPPPRSEMASMMGDEG